MKKVKNDIVEQFSLLQELEKELRIEQDNLDENWIRQPEIFWKVASLLARAIADRDGIKVDIDIAEAELYAQYREKAAEKDEKITESALKQQVAGSDRMQRLQRQLLEAQSRAGDLQAMKESFQQRSYALKELSGLYQANYFTVESGGKERSEVVDKTVEQRRIEGGKLRRAMREKARHD